MSFWNMKFLTVTNGTLADELLLALTINVVILGTLETWMGLLPILTTWFFRLSRVSRVLGF